MGKLSGWGKKISLILIFFPSLFFILFFLFLFKNNRGETAGIKTTASQIENYAFIGEHRFTLYGYTSPRALVTFSGLGIFDQTYADEKGYFEFKNRFSPFSPREACLTAQDQLGRLTSPVCLPPFPTTYNLIIGPVIMPPTLSLDKNDYYVGDEVILSGQTIPNTEVDLAMFINRKTTQNLTQNDAEVPRDLALGSAFFRAFSNPVEAASPDPFTGGGFALPKLTTTADDKGNFSLALPSSSAQTFRLFAQANHQENSSPASRKLTVKILPWWMIIVEIFLMLFQIIKSRLLEILIIIEIVGLAIYFLRRYLHPRSLAIVRRERFSLIKVN